MLFLAFALNAAAAPPTEVLWTSESLGGVPLNFAASEEGLWVSFVTDDARLLDVGAWNIHSAGCGATAAAVDSEQLYAACGTTVRRYHMVHGELTLAEDVWTADAGIRGLWVYEGELFAQVSGDTTDTLHRIVGGASTGEWDLPSGLSEGQIRDGRLYLWHGLDDISTMALPAGNPVISTAAAAASFDDMAVSYQQTPYAVSAATGTIYELVSPSSFQIVLAGLNNPSALAFSDSVEDPWAIVDSAAGLEVRDASAGLGAVTATLSPVSAVRDASVTLGHALLGLEDGTLAVASAGPWVEATVAPTDATEGDVVTLTYTVDRDAEVVVALGLDLLDATSVVGGQEASLEVTVDERFAEGASGLWVFATADGSVGHDRADVVVDSPPPAPTVEVGFGDASLSVTISGVSDTDLDHYVIYASDEAFEAGDYATGGPADFDPSDALDLPIEVSARADESVELTLSPLVNGVSYTIGARAVDAGGLEGPMSQTQSETPEPVFSAAELAGESGGLSCATTGGPAWLFAAGLFGLIGRRRSAGTAVAAGLMLSGTASAHPLCAGAKTVEEQREAYEKGGRDMTQTCADFEVRYGSRTIADESIQSVYGDNAHGMLMLEAGPQFSRLVEVDFGFGLYRKFDRAVSAGGDASEVDTMLTLWPVTLDGTFRLQLLDEQLLVPFVRAGIDYIMFGERWDDGAGGRAFVKGAKFGTHIGGGVNLLLDPFAPGRASSLEAQTGINDTFLTIEWRKTKADPGEGFDLSGTNISVGIKLDY